MLIRIYRVARTVLLSLLISAGLHQPQARAQEIAKPVNVVLFVSDGCGPASYTLAREYKRRVLKGSGLTVDPILTGTMSTWSADRIITDSAASATAMACGTKTANKSVGVDSHGQPVGSVLLAAQDKGMRTGLVSTTRIYDATPAAFVAHNVNRYAADAIIDEMLDSRVDLLIGGGRSGFLPSDMGGARKDGRNVLEEAARDGYDVFTDANGLRAASSLPVLGLLAGGNMAFELDRASTEEPSFEEITSKTLELLSKGDNGFFAMIENERTDDAGHQNDIPADVHEVLEFDSAIAAALRFARTNGNTLIIATSDHDTGGLALGRTVDGISNYFWYPEALQPVTSSVRRFLFDLRALIDSGAGIESALEFAGTRYREDFGLKVPSKHLLAETDRIIHYSYINPSNPNRLNPLTAALRDEIARLARLGWSTTGHTGVDVNVYAFGPGSELFRGNMDNTEIASKIASLLDLDLERVTRRLRNQKR